MTVEIGRKMMVGIGKETTYGTKASSITWLPVEEYDLGKKIEYVKNESSIGRIENQIDSDVSKKWAEPSLKGIVFDKSIGLALLGALGVVSTSADTPEVGVNTHAFTVKNDNDPISFTLVFKDDISTQMITGAIVNNFELDASIGEYVKSNISFIGKFPASTTDTPSYTDENEFLTNHLTVKFADTQSGLDAASAITVESAKITINKNAEAYHAVGSADLNKAINKNLECNGDFTMLYEDATYDNLWSAGTKKAIRFELTNSDVTIGSSSNPKLTIDFNQCNFEEWNRENGLSDIIKQTLGFVAEYKTGDSKMIGATLINTETSY